MSKSSKKVTPEKVPTKHHFSGQLAAVLGVILGTLILVFGFLLYFSDKVYPGIYVGGVSMMGTTHSEAKLKIDEVVKIRSSKSLVLNYQGQEFSFDLSSLNTNTSYDELVNQLFDYGRRKVYYKKVYLELPVVLNDSISNQVKLVADKIATPATEARIDFSSDSLTVTPSKDGLSLDEGALKLLIAQYINTGQLVSYELPIKSNPPIVSTQTAESIKSTLEQAKLSPIKLVFKDLSWELDYESLVGLLDLEKSQDYLIHSDQVEISEIVIGETKYSDRQFVLNEAKLEQYLNKLAGEINQEVQEPLLQYDGKRVTEFQAPTEGRKLDVKQAAILINTAVVTTKSQKEIALPVVVTPPKNQLVNDLGIKESLGQGLSYFAGSIPNRIYNVGLAASRINGVLVPPGGVFSFNEVVGDISAATGYKQAYVIKSGKTVLDDGGGVCQVSTTLFRAVLNAGLPVVTRTAHAYRVGYYEQGFPPGLDATIFHPSVDFKFKNDTDKHILIQAITEGTSLTVNLFGTSDGRVAVLSTPVTSGATPPPPEIREDDPTLPKGTIKQVEYPAWGAKVTFKRKVTRGGQELINETFTSNYRAWAAAYLVGTKEN